MIFFIFITFLEIYWFHKENQIFIKFNMIYLETITYWKTKLKFSIDSQSEHDLDFWTLVHDMTDGGKCWGKLGGMVNIITQVDKKYWGLYQNCTSILYTRLLAWRGDMMYVLLLLSNVN